MAVAFYDWTDRIVGNSDRVQVFCRVTPLGKQEPSQALRRELRGIPPLLRTPIELHYIDELPVKEVARQLGLTVPAVKSRLHRGHIFLRGRMLKHAPRRGTASLVAAD